MRVRTYALDLALDLLKLAFYLLVLLPLYCLFLLYVCGLHHIDSLIGPASEEVDKDMQDLSL